MRTLAFLALALVLGSCSAPPSPSATVADQALALGAALDQWSQSRGFVDWTLDLRSNRTDEVGRWTVAVKFWAPPTVAKDTVDRADLDFYPWFRSVAPGLVPEASFLRQETWSARLTANDGAIPPEFPASVPGIEAPFSTPEIRWRSTMVEGKTVQQPQVVWTWPADLSPELEAKGADLREKTRAATDAQWTRDSDENPPPFGSAPWSARAMGGAGLAEALEAAFRELIRLQAPGQPAPEYNLALGRRGPRSWWGPNNPWYPDTVSQEVGLAVDALNPAPPMTWDQWRPVRDRLGGVADVTYRLHMAFNVSGVSDRDTWRSKAQDDLSKLFQDQSQGWSWMNSNDTKATEEAELRVTSYDTATLKRLADYHLRHQK